MIYYFVIMQLSTNSKYVYKYQHQLKLIFKNMSMIDHVYTLQKLYIKGEKGDEET